MSTLRLTFLAACAITALTGANAEQVECASEYGEWFRGWCNTNCNHDPAFCPFPWCDCVPVGTGGPDARLVFLEAHPSGPDCCLESTVLWFTAGQGDLLYTSWDADEGDIQGPNSTLCHSFENAVDIELDASGGVFVADFNAATVYYVEPMCGDVYPIFSWHTHQISAPTTIAIIDGGLVVITLPADAVYVALGESQGRLVYLGHESIGSWERGVEDIEIREDEQEIYWVSGNEIWSSGPIEDDDSTKLAKEHDLLDDSYLYLDGNRMDIRIPDIADLYVSPYGCGIYFSSPDLNQVWHCTDYTNGNQSCSVYCPWAEIDADTCENTWNPWGVAGDCACNFYYTNKAGGSIAGIPGNYVDKGPGPVEVYSLIEDLWHPQDIEIWTGCPDGPDDTPSLRIDVEESKGACSTTGCVDTDIFANVTVRFQFSVDLVEADDSSVQVSAEDLIKWNPSDFELYIRKTDEGSTSLPFFSFSPAVLDLPIPNFTPIIAATASCKDVSIPGLAFAVAWNENMEGGPCYDSMDGEICADSGLLTDGAPWVDASGNSPIAGSRFFETSCPTTTK